MMTKQGMVWLMIFAVIFGLFSAFSVYKTASVYGSVNDYYVNPSTGSDSNDGSQAHPWKTLSHAMSSYSLGSNGTTIHLGNGEYGSIDFHSGGSSSARLVVQCDNGLVSAWAAKGQCTFSGSGGVAFETNYLDLVGTDIGNNPNMGFCTDDISNNGTTGNSIHIIGNYCHDLAGNVFPSAGDKGGAGCPENGALHYQGGISGTWAFRNVVARFGSVAARSNGCNFAQGIYWSGSTDAIAYDNIVAQPVIGGLVLGASCGAIFVNNTIVNTVDAIIFGDHDNSRCPGGVAGKNTIINNYMAGFTNAVFNVSNTPDCGSGSPTLFSHNATDGFGTDFKPARGSCDPGTMLHQAPTSFFVNYQTNGTGDYHLASGSIGINGGATGCVSGGVSPCTPSTDFEGKPMSPITIGAYANGSGGGGGGGSVSVNPTSLTFPDTFSGNTSQPLPLTLSNTTSGTVVVTAVTPSTNFSDTTTCATVLSQTTCTANVTFTPPSTGPFSGTVTFTFSGATGSPITVNVSGNGTTPSAPTAPTGLTVVVQ